MALNPLLYENGTPVPFVGEKFVLARGGVDFELDMIPEASDDHVKAKGTIYLSNIRMVFVAKKPVGNFVAFDMPLLFIHDVEFNQPIFHCNSLSGTVKHVEPEGENRALYSTHSFKEGGSGTFGSHFPNLDASVRQNNQHQAHHPLARPDAGRPAAQLSDISWFNKCMMGRAPSSHHFFKILFKEGGSRTFVPCFFNLIASMRQCARHPSACLDAAPRVVDPLQAAQAPVDEMLGHAHADPSDPPKIFMQHLAAESQLRRRTCRQQSGE